ncbi:MAG: DHH family phosphoesterase [Candidatus Palauibacterales bacterium]|nr:DHH family phosphoesterase [Candidatus Palauibacterales bacterium]
MSEQEDPDQTGEAPGRPAGDAAADSPDRETVEDTVRLAQMVGAVEDADRVLVLTHDNPDPDAIASSAALARLLEEEAGVETTLAFGGIVGRAENRALIDELGVRFDRVRPEELPTTLPIALVDTQPRTGNNSLPEGRIVSIVLDHHPVRPETTACSYADVRPEYGASCSILVEYLRAAGIQPGRRLATALFYGIQSETQDLGREAVPADVDASMYLYTRSDPAAIARIRHARVPASYYSSIHDALEEARRADGVVCVPAGQMDYPDMVAELADLFMRVEGVEWTLAAGRYHDDLLLSARSYEPTTHAGDVIRAVIGDRGSAGGHGALAGAQVPVGSLTDDEVDRVQRSLFRDFLDALGVDPGALEPVIPGGGEEG